MSEKSDRVSGARADVLAFYRELPFNYRHDVMAHAESIRKADTLRTYPPLVAVFASRPTHVDIGCGAGWLVNSAAFHYRTRSSGIDFNQVAVERARAVALALDLDTTFEVADRFRFHPVERPQVVTSIGSCTIPTTRSARSGILRATLWPLAGTFSSGFIIHMAADRSSSISMR